MPFERFIDRFIERPVDRFIERPIDRFIERPIDRFIERPMDRFIERPMDLPLNDRPPPPPPRFPAWLDSAPAVIKAVTATNVAII